MYQIPYDNIEQYNRIIEIGRKNPDFRERIIKNPMKYNYYIISDRFQDYGANLDVRDYCTTITIDEFDAIMTEKFEKRENKMVDMKIVDDLIANKIIYFHVKCPNIEIFEAIKRIGEKYGWFFQASYNVYEEYIQGYNGMYVVVYKDAMHHNSLGEEHEVPEIPLELFEQYLKTIKDKKENQIKIGEYIVIFKSDGSIKVGCHTIDFNTIGKIWGKALDNYQNHK